MSVSETHDSPEHHIEVYDRESKILLDVFDASACDLADPAQYARMKKRFRLRASEALYAASHLFIEIALKQDFRKLNIQGTPTGFIITIHYPDRHPEVLPARRGVEAVVEFLTDYLKDLIDVQNCPLEGYNEQ